ncbi:MULTISPECIES: serine hydrolase [unclassified Synechococcus]|uniref:serine hydrolase domain-containing protein n=1 Tax=unclassified Synechococcus TaxID=2626047 RepID=UPI0021A2C5D4|nr:MULTISPECIES: serine hydrolase domain-containing protein [unclassified Synechococcus]MCT0213697.1 beta-lactamase family protein [Synechococcus sp. CS-1326]MCT0234086.1 beta-lactamase family protein [Synechococcus sp. CS-1327]
MREPGAFTIKRFSALALTTALVMSSVVYGADQPAAETTAPASDRITLVENGLNAATTKALNQSASAAFAETSAPGAVMAVKTAEGTWVATLGYEDWARTVPMAADVNQRIGSVTKTFTVTALLQLAERGALSLDDPIETYVPGMPNGRATLAQLAEMRSGIPSYTFNQSFQDALFADPDTPWTPQQLVDLVKQDAPLFPPGEMVFYSNTNLVLLGMVIEQVTAKPIEKVLAEQILKPLGLDHTLMPTDATFAEPHARGYTLQGVKGRQPVDATDWNPSWGWTAGAMISSFNDLLVWGEALGTGKGILSAATQAKRLASFDLSVPIYLGPDARAPQTPTRAYGMGLARALDWYGHEGELPGFNTEVQHYKPKGITLVVMVNTDIVSGQTCAEGQPTVPGNSGVGPCQSAASRIAQALAAALGHPMVEPNAAAE